jgi:hypothetical protein
MNEDHKTKKDSLLTRRELARQWKVSIETLKRRKASEDTPTNAAGWPHRSFRMSDVVRIEQEGCGD